MATIKSNLKLISSNTMPTTSNLSKGEMAFGAVNGKNRLFGNPDGETILEYGVHLVQSPGTSTEDAMSQNAVTLMVGEAVNEAKSYTDAKVTSVYRYKGSVETVAELPTEDNVVGDTWNVIESGENYAWDGEAWDGLGGVVDLSGYYTKSEIDRQFEFLLTNGDGTKFLSDDGTYQTITLSVTEI